jgi:nucleotide-binding universal stress UspA family protein
MPYTPESRNKAFRNLNILLPVEAAAQAQQLLPLAFSLIGGASDSHISLIGVTPIAPDRPLSEGAVPAQRLRGDLERMAEDYPSIERLAGSFVSHQPWEDIEALIEERVADQDLMLLLWQPDTKYFQTDLARIMSDPPCNVAVVQPAVHPTRIKRILVPVRGGPFANLSLQLALRMARASKAEITILRVLSSDDDPMSQVLREKFTGLSDSFPEITTELQIVGDAGAAILRELRNHQAVILGASAAQEGSPIGLVATIILQRKDVTTLVVKTKEPFRLPASPVQRTGLPVLVQVEKWFAENTFHSREFSDVARLVELKRKQDVRISLGLPALNEEATVGNVIHSIKRRLMDDAPLLDEIILFDGNSTDHTRKIAAEMGVTPYVYQESLPGLGGLRGRGEALWKSLYLMKGDLLAWIDTDVVNPDPRLVYGIIGPMLADARIQFVKSFYTPAAQGHSTSDAEDAEVTESLVRPLISLLFPDLSGIVQPLAGMYGGRRAALERVPFYSGPGVDIGLLLDLADLFGLRAIAQADLGEVRRRDREPRAPGKKSFAILQVFAQHLKQKGMLDAQVSIERTMKVLRQEDRRLHLEELDVHEQQRPPMSEVKEYRGRHWPRRA